ncbi:thiolase family protein [Comamonas sp. Y33R10-2]|uniref:thiolase family protein n=1 Tax=Comamonas sp. Y33R10-2 TaxID=2853257 RepID=UPI001C5CA12E|nr:thiolase family protein [Comamonas sp. Y33R10-2]QXZ10862.1 thiolase family protein [Comamonas sp. Y33R10-2]
MHEHKQVHKHTPIIAWSRSPVAPVGGALSHLQAHEIAAPVLQALLAQTGLPAQAVDAVVLGNAMGAGGNPARLLALAAGLPDSCAAHSVDTQCCSGLDAIAMAVGLLQSGQAEVVIAGGAEAWSRAPIRQMRPTHASDAPQSYERPAFAPDPARDPDMLQSAANYAQQHGYSRSQQEQYALLSHARAAAGQASLSAEITAVAGLAHDTYPRTITPERAARMPAVAVAEVSHANQADLNAHALSALTVSAKADGAALILLATPEACTRWNFQARALWLASASIGAAPETPLLAAIDAAHLVLKRAAKVLPMTALSKQELPAHTLSALELHDAFAVQGLAFCQALGLTPVQINTQGGGLARGHPIGASGAIALVRCLARLQSSAKSDSKKQSLGMAAIAGAGGIGAATLVQWLGGNPLTL